MRNVVKSRHQPTPEKPHLIVLDDPAGAWDARLAQRPQLLSVTHDPLHGAGNGAVEPGFEEERRHDDRAKVQVYRTAILRWRWFQGLCLIRNIASGGLMCTLHADLERGERVTVEIRSGNRISGSVVWSRDGRIGVQFDEQIDVMKVLNGAPATKGALTPRMPRLRIACRALLTVDGRCRSTMLIDISQGGAKIEADLLRPDMQVTLTIPGLEPKRAMVRWSAEGRAGISFIAPIGFELLARWALERQSPNRMGCRDYSERADALAECSPADRSAIGVVTAAAFDSSRTWGAPSNWGGGARGRSVKISYGPGLGR